MLTFIGIALCIYLLLMAGWLFIASAGLRRVRGYTVITMVDLGAAIILFSLGGPVSAAELMALAGLLLGMGVVLLRRLRPARLVLAADPPTRWHDLEADLDPPRAPVRRHRRRGGPQ